MVFDQSRIVCQRRHTTENLSICCDDLAEFSALSSAVFNCQMFVITLTAHLSLQHGTMTHNVACLVCNSWASCYDTCTEPCKWLNKRWLLLKTLLMLMCTGYRWNMANVAEVSCILLGWLLRVDLITLVGLKCPSVHKKFLWFQWNLVCRYRSMSDAWRYAVWPDPRSRSWTLKSRKFNHFRRLSPPPFIMWAGKWPCILKLGHNT